MTRTKIVNPSNPKPMVFIVGVGAAIYLEEYAPKNRVTSFIEVNISNLAGVPSIVFGLLGLTIFVRVMEP
ncbi:hypothetical protein ACW7EJ_01045 [Acinetobacter soli]